MRTDHVEAILRTRRPRFIYTMPALHNPTGVTMSSERRDRLVMLARRHGVPVVEDDPYGELAARPRRRCWRATRSPSSTCRRSRRRSRRRCGWAGWSRRARSTSGCCCASNRSTWRRRCTSKPACATTSSARTTRTSSRCAPSWPSAARSPSPPSRAHWPASMRVAAGGDGYYLWATAPRDTRARALLASAERRGASFLFGEAFFAQSGGDHNFRLALTPVARGAIEEGIRRIGEAAVHDASLRRRRPGFERRDGCLGAEAFPSELLLHWYARHGRPHLPWRTTRDPYRIVVSELMLQQTQVERVIPIYEPSCVAFRRWRRSRRPRRRRDPHLARLGYNRRAITCSARTRRRRRHAGSLPEETGALLALPGIGPYTAAAIACFAFGRRRGRRRQPSPRPSSLSWESNIRRAPARASWTCSRSRPCRRTGADWNSALMDLGATVCTARAPKCLVCPLRDACAAAPIDPARLAARARDARAAQGAAGRRCVRAHDSFLARPYRRPLARRAARARRSP